MCSAALPPHFADLTGFPRSSSRWAPTRSSSTIPPASPPAHANAGVDVILDITADAPHVFQAFAGGTLDEADQALDRAALFLTQHIPSP